MKIIILFCLFFFHSYIFYAQQQVSFFVEGHADDWQLFMSKNIAEDLSFAKMVIITVTAGDAGHGNLAYGKGKIPYYLAREKGCVYSSKFAIDLLEGEVDEVPNCSMEIINGHSIARYVYKNNMVNYFLRLPDGIHGEGAPETGNQSLQRLKLGQISSINAVDNSATYKGWNDLTQTLKTIIQAEKGTDEEVWMNIQSSDRIFNSGDHPDHYIAQWQLKKQYRNSPGLELCPGCAIGPYIYPGTFRLPNIRMLRAFLLLIPGV